MSSSGSGLKGKTWEGQVQKSQEQGTIFTNAWNHNLAKNYQSNAESAANTKEIGQQPQRICVSYWTEHCNSHNKQYHEKTTEFEFQLWWVFFQDSEHFHFFLNYKFKNFLVFKTFKICFKFYIIMKSISGLSKSPSHSKYWEKDQHSPKSF